MSMLRQSIRVAALVFAPIVGFAGFWTATCRTLVELGDSDLSGAGLSLLLGLSALAVAVATCFPLRIIRRNPIHAISYGLIGLGIAVLGSIWLYSASRETNYESFHLGLFALAGCMLFAAPLSLALSYIGDKKDEPEAEPTTGGTVRR